MAVTRLKHEKRKAVAISCIFPVILRLLGRISRWDKGKRNLNTFKEWGVGKNIKLLGTLYTPCLDIYSVLGSFTGTLTAFWRFFYLAQQKLRGPWI